MPLKETRLFRVPTRLLRIQSRRRRAQLYRGQVQRRLLLPNHNIRLRCHNLDMMYICQLLLLVELLLRINNAA